MNKSPAPQTSTLGASPRRGRPASDRSRLDRSIIVAAARQVLDTQGRVGMRSTAAALGVDPMALYHYFPGRQALLDALVEQAFAPLDQLRLEMARLPDAKSRLRRLSEAYLACVVSAPQLAHQLARQGGGPLARRFDELFRQALQLPAEPDAGAMCAQEVLVDYLHGVALAGSSAAPLALERGWPLICAALASRVDALEVG